MSVWYLDLDDEITDAVARLRGATDDHVVLVIPPGSRIGTGRINFRLLAREAGTRHLSVSVVSGDAQVRALAVAAGLSSHASVMDAENASAAAEAAAAAADAAAASGTMLAVEPALTGAVVAAAVDPLATTSTAPGPSSSGSAVVAMSVAGVSGRSSLGGRFGRRAEPIGRDDAAGQSYTMTPRAATAASDTGWTDTGALATDAPRTAARGGGHKVRNRAVKLSVLAVLLGGLSYGAYQVLPTATVALTAGLKTLGPETFRITAQRGAQTDTTTGIVPAVWVPIQLTATGHYPATDRRLALTQATGNVVFTDKQTGFDTFIAKGTIVSTAGGIDFVTQTDITIPAASVDSGATKATAPIKARKGGTDGNVAAGAISVVPKELSSQLISVNNPAPTTGGTQEKARWVSPSDYATAIQKLTDDLQQQLDARLLDPTLPPVGHTVFPASQDLGTPIPDHTQADLVGPDGPTGSFDLTLTTVASVLAVDENLVAETAGQKLVDSAPSGTIVHPDTLTSNVGKGVIAGGKVLFDVAVQAQAYTTPDPVEIKNRIKGQPVSEAQRILDDYGKAQISVWPGFPATIPDDVRRITLTITDPEVPSP